MKKALIQSPIAPYYLEPKACTELDDEGWYGHIVNIIEDLGNGWFRIDAPYRYKTFARGGDMCFDETEIANYELKANLMRVWKNSADVLDRTDYQGGILKTLYRGAIVDVLESTVEVDGEKTGWSKVRLIGGETGFMRRSWLGTYYTSQNGDEEHFRNAVVETALSYMGSHYRWGGKSPNGIDCSGLTGASYMMNGVLIFRNANIVEGYPIREIPREQMTKGDLLFFKGHVALYIGDGKYVHSTGRVGDDGVVINSLNPSDADYRKDLAEGIEAVGSIF